MNEHIISVSNLTKQYDNGTKALDDVSLDIQRGELFALLGPNGAGKTTLISAICGLIKISSGTITVGGYDHERDYRDARRLIGLVPQELMLDIFATVMETIEYSRGYYGKKSDPQLFEQVLRDLALWDKRDSTVGQLSGGMKRRVMIAKALMNEPDILFLDEPTAGVDVELRKGMWEVINRLKQQGTTIILTTHYLEEAEMMADRVGIISRGAIQLVEDKDSLMQKMGHKTLCIELDETISSIPSALSQYNLSLSQDGDKIEYQYKTGNSEGTGITTLLQDIKDAGIRLSDISTKQSSLEEIFLSLTERTNN